LEVVKVKNKLDGRVYAVKKVKLGTMHEAVTKNRYIITGQIRDDARGGEQENHERGH